MYQQEQIQTILGGTHSWTINHLAMLVWIEHQIFLTMENLPGLMNQVADEE